MTLEVAEISHDGRGTESVSDPPAGHSEGLADSVDDNGEVLCLRYEVQDLVVLFSAVDKAFINLVEDDDDIVFHSEFSEIPEALLVINGARRVVWRVDYHGTGSRSNGFFYVIVPGDEFCFARVHENRFPVEKAYLLHVTHPCGGEHQNLVAGIDDTSQSLVKQRLGPRPDNNVCGGIFKAEMVFVIGADRLPKLRNARSRGIVGLSLLHCFFSIADCRRGRVEIWFAGAEGNNRFSFPFETLGFCSNGEGC
ncbi:hypothetical protein SDC9_76507 [bioreactor metagenome]|uniref:Uncharacterized protein n=1 Tax=bioreactor metagenome TaxID=1076179 RepID=A0A644YN07_9ZZZZ